MLSARTLLSAALFTPMFICAQTLSVVNTVQDDACSEGLGCITTSVSGGTPPYTFFWQPEPPNGQGTAMCCGLFSGTYTLTLADADGSDTTLAVIVGDTPALLVSTVPGQAVACGDPCNGQWLRTGAVGGTAPYTVIVEPPAGTASAAANWVEVQGMCVGEVYTITVSDANGCQAVIAGVPVVEVGPPQIVSIEQQGLCEGTPWNFAQVTFDQPLSQVGVVAGTGTVNITGNTVMLTGMGWGTNIFTAIGMSPFCMQQFSIGVGEGDGLYSVAGTVRADVDGNCIADATDPAIPGRMVRVEPNGWLTLTVAAGTYGMALCQAGPYTAAFAGAGYATACLTPYPVPFSVSVQNPTAQADLLLTPTNGPDASAFVQTTFLRPGFETRITAVAQNNSPYTMADMTLALDYDPLLQLSSLSAPASVNDNGHLEWVLDDLQPFTSVVREVYVTTPPSGALIGTTVAFAAGLVMSTPDAEPLNDTYSITSTIVGAYDPNDKLALTSSRSSTDHYFLDQDHHVDFTIRFQNTGTVEAIDVYLLDTISPLFDLASFELLGASHAMEPSLLDDRVLRFDFLNIMLPDSASDPVGSQGFASFRLKPTQQLTVGMELRNAADIFFDFNEPIRTNTTSLVAEFFTDVPSVTAQGLQVYPNPATDRIHVRQPCFGPHAVEVWSMDGRLVVARTWLGDQGGIDISALSPGLYLLHAFDAQGLRQETRFVRR